MAEQDGIKDDLNIAGADSSRYRAPADGACGPDAGTCDPDAQACETPSIAEAVLKGHLRPELFKALGDPVRVEVLARLACASRPLTVTEITGCCGIHISGVSRHLGQLRDAGIVSSTKNGREMRYELNASELAGGLRSLADAIEGCREAFAEWRKDDEPKDR